MRTSRIVVAAEVIAAAGRAAEAARLVGWAGAQYEELGAAEPWAQHDIAEIEAVAMEQLGEAARVEAAEAGRRLTTDEAFALANEALSIEAVEGEPQ
jgi:hypothetical protein